MVTKHSKKISFLILVLSLFGLGIAGYSLAYHNNIVSGSFCTLNATFDCGIVSRGPYSEIAGIPVALIGIFGYLLLGAGAILHLRQSEDIGSSAFLVLASTGGLGFSGYLTGLEAWVIHAWCLLCLVSQATILSIFIASLFLLFSDRKVNHRLNRE
ncbi:MAG: Vitamin K epoxide reductase family protein [Candidatus Uhrbacteria bacterium GW2011_GWF2_41_16]|jgi:uncharacterized membrane protein|uniref:Vitamin K epoxide reductase family protein n=2 Tax=Candidatus Uhriibacteriota TaxID=1752732 RepID=A0A0G0XM89_9BACT|nr:MAG: Vitamin K epoxide reductase family protein [Candidatus Uhrbacteria bacterium GW2011_GWC2_41_11]KKR97910.1 MAG: Vitamin K epoxide reductase family protein [Candidatus Uhrbacteria bacterium GW2011_GWF2_41_16]HBO99595.1 vitamin K epoxide reductase [Candidatus Uhrbacteria bacterium]